MSYLHRSWLLLLGSGGIAGTGNIEGLPGELDGTGSAEPIVIGTGDISGIPGVLDGEGSAEVVITGTGSIDGLVGELDGVGIMTPPTPVNFFLERNRFLLRDPGIIGPRFAGGEPAPSIIEDDFLIWNPLETSILDYFFVEAAVIPIAHEIFDRFDVFRAANSFNDMFDILEPVWTPRGKAPEGSDPTTEAQVVRSARVQNPIGKVDI